MDVRQEQEACSLIPTRHGRTARTCSLFRAPQKSRDDDENHNPVPSFHNFFSTYRWIVDKMHFKETNLLPLSTVFSIYHARVYCDGIMYEYNVSVSPFNPIKQILFRNPIFTFHLSSFTPTQMSNLLKFINKTIQISEILINDFILSS